MLSEFPEDVLASLRRLCLQLPGATEKVSHGIPAFEAGGRIFAYFRHDHHGDHRTVVCVKTDGRDEQDLLIGVDPDLYSWPAYLGASGWIAMNLTEPKTDWGHVEDRVRASHAQAVRSSTRR